MRAQLDPERTLADTISPGSEWVETAGGRKHVLTYLADFLFPPQRAQAPVKTLSGGERNRLLLARLFAQPANLLVLDEPTNDLDIESLELLEDTLQSYPGTLLLVSHDRAFLDNVVTQTLVAGRAPAMWKEYVGGYSDWVAQRPAAKPRGAGATAQRRRRGTTPRARARAATEAHVQGTARARALPAEIEALEREQHALTAADERARLPQARAGRDQGGSRARRGESSISSRRSSSAGACWTHAHAPRRDAAEPRRNQASSLFAQPRLGSLDLRLDRLALRPGELGGQRVEEYARSRRHQPPARKHRPRADRRQTPVGQHLDELAALQVRQREVIVY